MPVAVGETFERYEIESLIGRGGMGEVYRAVDTRLRRKVALKVLRPDRDNADAVARLFREARSAAVLAHPNTVAIHDIGESEGIFYIVMELVTGMSMLAYVGDARVPAARKLGWLVDVARALGAAHKAGVIHRDIKPSNVMVSDDGIVKVLDFGLAKPLAPVSFRTQAGHVLGTPRYMAPEQLAGAEIDARTDQYAYGLTAYELVAGKHPGGALAGPIEVPRLDTVAPDVSRAVAEVVARAMAQNPEDRFASMEEVAVALEDAIAGRLVRGGTPGATPPDAGGPSEITALEGPATDAPITDTVRFGGDVSAATSEGAIAATTKRAGGAGAAVVAQIDFLPAVAAGPEGASDPEADRPTVTARTTAASTLLMADAPAVLLAKGPPRTPDRTLLSAEAPAAPALAAAPVAKTLLAAGSVPPEPEITAARDRAVKAADADAKAKADAKADADARARARAKAKAKAKAGEGAAMSLVPAGLQTRKRSGLRLAGGIVVLGACAFGGAYYASKQLAQSGPPVSSTAAADAAILTAPSATATAPPAAPTGTLSITPLGSTTAPSATASIQSPVASRRPPRPATAPPATSSPLEMKIR